MNQYSNLTKYALPPGGVAWRAVMFALLLLVGVGAAQADTCGKLNGRPCLITERIPSCDHDLIEAGGMCIHPACGRLNDRPCSAFERPMGRPCDMDLVPNSQRLCGRPGDGGSSVHGSAPVTPRAGTTTPAPSAGHASAPASTPGGVHYVPPPATTTNRNTGYVPPPVNGNTGFVPPSAVVNHNTAPAPQPATTTNRNTGFSPLPPSTANRSNGSAPLPPTTTGNRSNGSVPPPATSGTRHASGSVPPPSGGGHVVAPNGSTSRDAAGNRAQ